VENDSKSTSYSFGEKFFYLLLNPLASLDFWTSQIAQVEAVLLRWRLCPAKVFELNAVCRGLLENVELVVDEWSF
jgi:hypothetical protein